VQLPLHLQRLQGYLYEARLATDVVEGHGSSQIFIARGIRGISELLRRTASIARFLRCSARERADRSEGHVESKRSPEKAKHEAAVSRERGKARSIPRSVLNGSRKHQHTFLSENP